LLWASRSSITAHSDLLVSLANYMGLDITTFGNAAVCKGPLPGRRA
jgi:hypothetical protein